MVDADNPQLSEAALELSKQLDTVASLCEKRPSLDFKTWDLVGFGDPVYPEIEEPDTTLAAAEPQEDPLSAEVRSIIDRGIFDGGLKPLPFTRRELTEIGRLFPEETVRIHLREKALEEYAKRNASKGRILHFATHGFADQDPAESFLALTIPKTAAEHNGLLQGWEIHHRLRLQADLVVLSACQTSLGKDYGGEGLMSLARTFQVAGTRTVVASQWSVNDASTAELMIRFYRYLIREGKSKDEALQAAQLDLIRGPIETVDEDGNPVTRDFSSPYYWAAFQVIGDRL